MKVKSVWGLVGWSILSIAAVGTAFAQKSASESATVAKMTADLQKRALSTETSPEALRGLQMLAQKKAILDRLGKVGTSDDGKQWAMIGAALSEAMYYASVASQNEVCKNAAVDYLSSISSLMDRRSDRTRVSRVLEGVRTGTATREQVVEDLAAVIQGLNTRLDGSSWWYFSLGSAAGSLTAQAALQRQDGMKEQVSVVETLAHSVPESASQTMIPDALKRITRFSGKVGYSEADFGAVSLAADGVMRAVVVAATGGSGGSRE